MMSALSLGCLNLTSPNPSPRSITSRLKFGVSGPQELLCRGASNPLEADVSLLQPASTMMLAVNTMKRVGTSIFASSTSGSDCLLLKGRHHSDRPARFGEMLASPY